MYSAYIHQFLYLHNYINQYVIANNIFWNKIKSIIINTDTVVQSCIPMVFYLCITTALARPNSYMNTSKSYINVGF